MNETVSKLATQASGVLAGTLVLAAMPAFAQAAPQPAATAPAAPTAKQLAAEKQTKPAGKSVNYKVGPGDTLWGIAKKFNVDPSSLMAWNNITTYYNTCR